MHTLSSDTLLARIANKPTMFLFQSTVLPSLSRYRDTVCLVLLRYVDFRLKISLFLMLNSAWGSESVGMADCADTDYLVQACTPCTHGCSTELFLDVEDWKLDETGYIFVTPVALSTWATTWLGTRRYLVHYSKVSFHASL